MTSSVLLQLVALATILCVGLCVYVYDVCSVNLTPKPKHDVPHVNNFT